MQDPRNASPSAVEARSTMPVATATSSSFGAMLKRYRRAASLTQAALAERAGYSVSHISKLESAARLPISATIELLADALALSPAERGTLERAARRGGRLPQVPPHTRSRPLLPLVGRDHEIACIERHLVADAEPPLLLFAGDSGIGKTRLLQAAAERGVSSGWRVLEGVCRRHSMQGPYGPLLDALANAIRPLDRPELHAALDGCMWLVRLLPELAERGAVPMPAWSLPADQERRLMFAAVERFLRNIAGPAGTLLVLDDLHWAETDTLDMLSALVERAPQSPLRIIGAYRHNDVCPGNDLTALIADLAREGLVMREVIEPLSPPAASEMLDALLSDTGDGNEHIRAEVLRLAGGMPFVLVSYAHWLRSRADQEGRVPLELGIPWDVTQTVEQRIMMLSEAAQVVIRIAAVSDGDDPRELLVGVARQLGYDEPDASAAIDAACEAGVLVHQGDDTYAFTYDLIQAVVERGMGAAQHAYFHREIARALEGQHRSPRVEALAEHYELGGEPEKALIYLERAGARAKALHAYTDAERLYRSVTAQMASLARWREAAHARTQLGIMLGYLGRYEDALVELDAALNSYRNEGWTDEQMQVAAQIGRVYYAQGEIERGIVRLEHEAAAADGASDRSLATLHLSLATLYGAAGLYRRELEEANDAAELAFRASDRHRLALAELERGTALGMLDRLGDGVRALEDAAVPLTRATGDLWTEAQALDRAARNRILCGEFAEARVDIERGLQLAWRLDDELVAACMTLNRGILRFYTGAWRQAQADLRWSCAALQQSRLPSRAAHALVWLGHLSLAKGRWERAAYEIGRGLDLALMSGEADAAVLAHCALAERELLDGQPEAARMRLEPLLEGGEYQVADVSGVLALLGWAHLQLGDERQSRTLIAAGVVRASATGLRCVLADALRIQALVAAHEGQWTDALADIAEALSVARMLSYPYAEAKTLSVSGQLLIQHNEAERGQEQLSAARDRLHQLGEVLYTRNLDRASASTRPS